MTLEQQIVALAQAIAADVRTLFLQDGNLSALNTTAKGNLVAAINEALATVQSSARIDDSAVAGNTTSTYSANKIIDLVNALKTQILGGASAAYDTLLEIQTALQNDTTSITNLLNAVGTRVAFDAAQSLTQPQKAQARANIGALSTAEIGDPDHNFVADYAAAKA